jgi:hypothetical protein
VNVSSASKFMWQTSFTATTPSLVSLVGTPGTNDSVVAGFGGAASVPNFGPPAGVAPGKHFAGYFEEIP